MATDSAAAIQALTQLAQEARQNENADIPAFPTLTVGRKVLLEQEADYLRNPYGCYIKALLNPIGRNANIKGKAGSTCKHSEIHCGICLNCGEVIDVIRAKDEAKKNKANSMTSILEVTSGTTSGSLDSDSGPGSIDSDPEDFGRFSYDMDKNVYQAFLDTNVPEYIRDNAIKICKEFPRNRIFGLRGANKDRLVFACTYYAYCETGQRVDLNVLGDTLFRTSNNEVTYTGSGKIRIVEPKNIIKALKDFSEGQTGFKKRIVFVSPFDHIMNFFSSSSAKSILPENIFSSYYINEIRNFIESSGVIIPGSEKKLAGCFLFCFLETNGSMCEFGSDLGKRISEFFDLKESIYRTNRKKILQTRTERKYSGASAAAVSSTSYF